MKNKNSSLNRNKYRVPIIVFSFIAFFILYSLQTYNLMYPKTDEKQEYIEEYKETYKPNIPIKH
jgi:hypothetical protein